MSTIDESMQFAVRFNYQKMAPLGIADDDYRRIAMALDIPEDGVRALCLQFHRQNIAVAKELFPDPFCPNEMRKICFIGDSITSERTSYMNILRAAFQNQPNVRILDCATSSWKTSDVIFSFEGIVPAFRPDIIHMMIGSNDARNAFPGTDASTAGLEGYRRNITQLIRTAKGIGATVIVSTVPPTKASAPLANGSVPVWETVAFNRILRDVCRQENVVLNDMEAILTEKLDAIIDIFDHIHLNAEGQKLMAVSVYRHLKEALLK